MLVVSDFQTIETLLVKQHQSLDRDSRTMTLFGTILPQGQIALPTADKWKHHRRIIGPAMTSKYLSLTTPKANEAIGELVKLWRLKIAKAGGRAWVASLDIENATMVSRRERILRAKLDAGRNLWAFMSTDRFPLTMCTGNMAFGTSWGCLSSSMEQITAEASPTAGPVGEVTFRTDRPDLAVSTWHILDVSE